MFYFSDRSKAVFSGFLSQGKVANAYLLSGPSGALLPTAIDFLAMGLNCSDFQTQPCLNCRFCRLYQSKSLVDCHYLHDKSIKIDHIREIQDRVKYGPTEAKYLVMIIESAHLMTSQAANAFLKLLEEPPKGVVFILTAVNMQKVLSTIRSRCQCFELPVTSSENMAVYSQSIDSKWAECFDKHGISLAHGMSLLMKRDLDPDCLDAYMSFDKFSDLSMLQKLQLAELWAQEKGLISLFLAFWIHEIWEGVSLDLKKKLDKIEILIDKIVNLEYNLNTRLALESLFLAI